MAALGTLQPSRNGGWTGSVFVLAHAVKIRLIPNDNHENPKAPAYRIFAGEAELGAFWQRQTHDQIPREFLSGEIEFPGLQSPITLAAFYSEDGKSARIVWPRSRKEERNE